MESSEDGVLLDHHKQSPLCTNRPAYRQGRKLTAVKVFTINNESQHLLVFGVPKINLRSEMKALCSKYGQVLKIHASPDHKAEVFTECFHVLYERIQSARFAKRQLDNKSFYGGVLHVCYAPELETVEELRLKLRQREKDVLSRLYADHKEKTSPETAMPAAVNYIQEIEKYDPIAPGNSLQSSENAPSQPKKARLANSVDLPKNPSCSLSQSFQAPSFRPVPPEEIATKRTTLIPTKVLQSYRQACKEKKIVISDTYKSNKLV